MVPDRIGSDSGTFNLNCTPVCAGRQNYVRKKHLPFYEETGLSEISGHGGDLRKSDFYGAAMYRAEYHTFYIRKKSQPALFCLQIILSHIGYLIQRPLAPQGRTSPSSLTGSPISELSTLPPKFGTMALSII